MGPRSRSRAPRQIRGKPSAPAVAYPSLRWIQGASVACPSRRRRHTAFTKPRRRGRCLRSAVPDLGTSGPCRIWGRHARRSRRLPARLPPHGLSAASPHAPRLTSPPHPHTPWSDAHPHLQLRALEEKRDCHQDGGGEDPAGCKRLIK